MKAEQRIIIALDTHDTCDARQKIEELSQLTNTFKIGLELLSVVGATYLITLKFKYRADFFLDAKFNDIPNTVGKASHVVGKIGAKMFTVHASAGPNALRQAVANKKNSMVFAVTILTSLNKDSCQQIFGKSPAEKVIEFAQMAKEANVDGIVCSPQEITLIRSQRSFDSLKIITPGIRPQWAPINDQERTMTPREAIDAGADYLVIGRPILQPPDQIGSSIDALQTIINEIKG